MDNIKEAKKEFDGEISRELFNMNEKLNDLGNRILRLRDILSETILNNGAKCKADDPTESEELQSMIGIKLRGYNNTIDDLFRIINDIINRIEF